MTCRRRVTALVVALGALAIGCGSAGTDGSAPRAESDPVPTATAATEVIRYGNLELSVPAGWPVYDVAADPTTCVRFDVNAVYLGSPSPEMRCPSQAIGRADAVLLEPASAPPGPGDEHTAASVTVASGLSVELDTSDAVEHELVATVPSVGQCVSASHTARPTRSRNRSCSRCGSRSDAGTPHAVRRSCRSRRGCLRHRVHSTQADTAPGIATTGIRHLRGTDRHPSGHVVEVVAVHERRRLHRRREPRRRAAESHRELGIDRGGSGLGVAPDCGLARRRRARR